MMGPHTFHSPALQSDSMDCAHGIIVADVIVSFWVKAVLSYVDEVYALLVLLLHL